MMILHVPIILYVPIIVAFVRRLGRAGPRTLQYNCDDIIYYSIETRAYIMIV